MNLDMRIAPVNHSQAEIHLAGKLLIQQSTELRAQLLQVLSQFTNGTIYLSNIHRIDISVLQVLAAFKNSADAQGKSFRLVYTASPYLENILALSGFNHLFETA